MTVNLTIYAPTAHDDPIIVIGPRGERWYLGPYADDTAATAAATLLPSGLQNGYVYLNTTTGKTRVRVAGAWANNDADAQDAVTAAQLAETNAETAETNAETAQAAAEAARDAALAGAHFRSTIAEGIADFAVGEYFTSTDDDALTVNSGQARMYKRIVGSPFYEDQGDEAAVWASFRNQAAGGVVSTGRNIIIGEPTNLIASDLASCTIGGGGRAGWNNVIGGDVTNVNTSTPNAVATGTNANYSIITGGYDNVASGLMSVISGAHNYTTSATTHGTIAGGSVQKIVAGDYNVIGGGQINEITAGDYCTVAGGGSHIINLPAGEDGATIGGGFDHTITARYSTISGGNQNSASGVASTVGGGQLNVASGAQATVSGGDTNLAGGTASAIAGGAQITLSATSARSDYAGAVGGYQNTLGSGSAARFSGMLAGRSNTVNGEYAATLGGRELTASGEGAVAMGYGAQATLPGQFARASGYFSAAGDAQASQLVMRRQTTDATPTELRLGSTLGSRLTLSNDSLYAFHILVIGRGTGSDTQRAGYEIKGCISVTAAGSTALAGTPTVTILMEDNAAWDCTVAADNTNKALQINVTGEAATTINWVADVRLVKVTA